MDQKQGYTYILCSKKNGTLYIGVTSNLVKRIWEHKNKFADGFTKKYNISQLCYYEVFDNIRNAIEREKQLKQLRRKEKLDLIEIHNPDWNDLYYDIIK